jgi:hypothetical protein
MHYRGGKAVAGPAYPHKRSQYPADVNHFHRDSAGLDPVSMSWRNCLSYSERPPNIFFILAFITMRVGHYTEISVHDSHEILYQIPEELKQVKCLSEIETICENN